MPSSLANCKVSDQQQDLRHEKPQAAGPCAPLGNVGGLTSSDPKIQAIRRYELESNISTLSHLASLYFKMLWKFCERPVLLCVHDFCQAWI